MSLTVYDSRAPRGKYPSLSGQLCGVTSSINTTQSTCGGGQTFNGITVPSLNTTSYTPLLAPLAGNNPGVMTRLVSGALGTTSTFPPQVLMVRDNSTGTNLSPTVTKGAALGTGASSVTVVAGSSDTSSQLTLAIGTSPASGVEATGVFSLATSRFSAPFCQMASGSVSTRSIVATQTGWTLSNTGTAAAGTVSFFCKLD